MERLENDDSYNRVDNKSGDWNDDNRLGKSLSLREDLYSWALVTCFNRDYLAQIMFFKKIEAEKKKMEDELAGAKKWLENSREIAEEANSKNKGDVTILVTFHEELVAKIESKMQQEDMPTVEEFSNFVS